MNEILTSLRRTPYQTFAAFSVLFFTLMLSGILFTSVMFLQGLLQYVETRPRIIVYFQIKAKEQDISAVREMINKSEKAERTRYISKQDAFKIYREFTKNDPLLLEMTSPDILPASLEIDAKQPEYLPHLAELVKNQSGVDEVQYQKNIVENLLRITKIVRQVTAGFFGYLFFMSLIVLGTTISFKVALKKEEIALMKLLGATSWYIRRPFVRESVLLGIFAALCASAVLIALFFFVNSLLSGYFSSMSALWVSLNGVALQVWPFQTMFIAATTGVMIVFSLFISLIASFTATNKYL